MNTIVISLLGSAVALLSLCVYAASQPACFPWRDAVRVQPVSCYNATGHANPTWQAQTISEMTARSGLTAELLSAIAALSLISVYSALCHLRKTMPSQDWSVVNATFAVGALGFVGLKR